MMTSSILERQKHDMVPSDSFSISKNFKIPIEELPPKLHPTLAAVQAAAKRVLEQPLIFNVQNPSIEKLNNAYHLTANQLQIFVSQVFSSVVTDDDYNILKKYQNELKDLAKNIDQAQANHLINHQEKQKAELLLYKAGKFINRSAEIMRRRETYQIAGESLDHAMEEFSEISYNPENGDPLLSMQAMGHMLDQLNALAPRYVHSSRDLPDYIKDQYAGDLNAVEWMLEPFYEAVQRKVQSECSALSHLLKDPNHSVNAAIQLKALQGQIGCMDEMMQNMQTKMQEWMGRWSSLNVEDRAIFTKLKTLDKHLKQLHDLLKAMHKDLGEILIEKDSIPTIPYGKEAWHLLVNSRPKRSPGFVERFIKKTINYLNPIEYLPKQWRPTSLQIKGAFLLTLAAGQQLHKYSQMFDQASAMRLQADRLQKEAQALVPKGVSKQIEKEKGFLGTLLADKYEVIVSNPSLISKLASRFPETKAFISDIVARCGSIKPTSTEIQQFMQDYENIRLAPITSPFTFQTPQEWYRKFTSSEDFKKDNHSTKDSSSFEKTKTMNRNYQEEEVLSSMEVLRNDTYTNLTNALKVLTFKKAISITWDINKGHQDRLQKAQNELHGKVIKAIAETPSKNASLHAFATWTQNAEDLSYALQTIEDDWINVISLLPHQDRLNLFENLADQVGEGRKFFLRLARKMTISGIITISDWSHLVKKLNYWWEDLPLGLAKLFIEMASDYPYLKHLVDLKDNNGWSPIFWFTMSGDKTNVERLLELGADLNSVDNKGFTCSTVAVATKHEDILSLFINAKADLNRYAFEKGGWTPLLRAAAQKQEKTVRMLIEGGANLNLKQNYINNTALHLAIINNSPEIAELLIKAGAYVDELNLKGRTPLHFAIEKGYLEIVKLLIAFGADPYLFVGESAGYNYVIEAQSYRRDDIEKYLIDRFPLLAEEADEIFKIKLIGHAWEIRGNVVLNKKALLVSREIPFEIIHRHAFLFHMANTIEKAFKNRPDLLSIETRNTIANTLRKTFSIAYSPMDRRTDFLAGQPVIISTGWDQHAIVVVIFQSNFIICNKGGGSLKPIEAYTIDPNRITEEFIERLILLGDKKDTDLQDFFGEVNPLNPQTRINSPLLTQLNCLEDSNECVNSFFDEIIAGSYESRGFQKVNNCAWESLEVAVYVLMNLLTLAESNLANTSQASSRLIKDRMTIAFKEWEEFTQIEALENYFQKLQNRSKITISIMNAIVRQSSLPKLSKYRDRFVKIDDDFGDNTLWISMIHKIYFQFSKWL